MNGPRKIDVVLVVPPFASAVMPMLGPSLLKSKLVTRGMSACVIYANLVAAQALGVRRYQDAADSDVRRLWGEALSFLAGRVEIDRNEHDPLELMPKALRSAAGRLRSALDKSARAIARRGPRIVGFSSSFQQNAASIVLARQLRYLCPSAVLVIGGANMDAPMGAAFGQRCDGVFDYVFSGEADVSFPKFCEDVLGGRQHEWPAVIESGPASPADFAITPEFDDYFEQGGEQMQLSLVGERVLPFESSRGCWWGQKHHCSFCGLNANGMEHRLKPAPILTAELQAIVSRYSPDLLFATDNILPQETVRRTTNLHSRAGDQFRFFFETKSNLSEEDLDRLVRMGVWEIQPGIESFSTRILRALKKGNSGPAHLCLLREASSRQISVTWNLLVDIPGDLEADYRAMLDLIPALTHLQPPTGCTPIRIDRYSPYFQNPQAFGLSNVRPVTAFSHLFGKEPAVAEMCYFFDADYTSAFRRSPELASDVSQSISSWRKTWADDLLRRSLIGFRNRSGEYLVVEQIGGDPPRVTPVPQADEMILFRTKRPTPANSLALEEQSRLEYYRDRHVVARFEDQYVFLATEPWRGLQLRAPGEAALDDHASRRPVVSETTINLQRGEVDA